MNATSEPALHHPHENSLPPPHSWAVSWREWGLVVLVSTIVALAAFLPYALGYVKGAEGREFLGFVMNVRDQNTYFMWMSQVAAGDFSLRNLYSSIPHDGAMLNLYFILAGLPARFGLLSLDASYQVARVLSSIALGVAVYWFAALFWPDERRRRLGWLTVMFAAGLGWAWQIAALFQKTAGAAPSAEDLLLRPVDLWVPEIFPFYSILIMPHFTMALAVLLANLRLMAIGLLQNRFGMTVWAGIALFLLSFVHPYDVIVIFLLAGATAVLMTLQGRGIQPWRHLAILFVLGAPPVVYNYLILNNNPGMRAWLVQNKSMSPAPWVYLAGLGILVIPALAWLAGFLRDRRQWSSPQALIASWMLTTPPLLYAPIAFQRRLAFGFSIPIAIAGLQWVLRRLEPGEPGETLPDTAGAPRASAAETQAALPDSAATTSTSAATSALVGGAGRRLAIATLITFCSLTSLFHFANAFRRAKDVRGENYVDLTVVQALRAIGAHGGRGTVLCSYETGNIGPRYTGLPVVIGSRGQTADFDRTLAETRDFFRSAFPTASEAAFLDRHRVEFVLIGPDELRLASEATRLPALEPLGFALFWKSPDDRVRVFQRPWNGPGNR